ncbi:MAG TPA: DinB family protein [Puia sp.]|nr:DinB family protein [Puia sp.]
MSNQERFVESGLLNWEQAIGRASAFFDKCTDAELLQPIVPGKNRVIYLLGHLAAIHDRMLPLLGIGERRYPHLDELFITSPDNPAASLPEVTELRNAWKVVNEYITGVLRSWSPEEWLQRHTAVSAEDFAREPHRNKFTLVLNRARHVDYHVGQLVWFKK